MREKNPAAARLAWKQCRAAVEAMEAEATRILMNEGSVTSHDGGMCSMVMYGEKILPGRCLHEPSLPCVCKETDAVCPRMGHFKDSD